LTVSSLREVQSLAIFKKIGLLSSAPGLPLYRTAPDSGVSVFTVVIGCMYNTKILDKDFNLMLVGRRFLISVKTFYIYS